MYYIWRWYKLAVYHRESVPHYVNALRVCFTLRRHHSRTLGIIALQLPAIHENLWSKTLCGRRQPRFLYFSMSCFTLSKSHVLNHTLSASNRGRRNMSRWTESRILFISDTTLWTPNLYRKRTYIPHFSYTSYQPHIVFFTHIIHFTSTTFSQHFNHITFFRTHNQYIVKMPPEIYLTPRY